MPVSPGEVKAQAPSTEDLVAMLQAEAAAIHQGRDIPMAFVCSIVGNMVEWGIAQLPRTGSGHPDSTENERIILHQIRGLITGLADIY